jgi:hypothetical protein
MKMRPAGKNPTGAICIASLSFASCSALINAGSNWGSVFPSSIGKKMFATNSPHLSPARPAKKPIANGINNGGHTTDAEITEATSTANLTENG